MKNIFKFFLVAMMATAMMFSACKKDDDKNELEVTPSETNQNKEKIIVSAPEVIYPKQYQ